MRSWLRFFDTNTRAISRSINNGKLKKVKKPSKKNTKNNIINKMIVDGLDKELVSLAQEINVLRNILIETNAYCKKIIDMFK